MASREIKILFMLDRMFMTAKVINENRDDLRKGFWPVLVVCLVFLGVGLLPKEENGKLVFGKMWLTNFA